MRGALSEQVDYTHILKTLSRADIVTIHWGLHLKVVPRCNRRGATLANLNSVFIFISSEWLPDIVNLRRK